MIYKHSVFDTWLIESESVQAVITSPPYFALRKYDIPDVIIGEWKGQYGLESTPQMYVEHTLLWAKEAWRVLRNGGVFFLNIADSYSGSGGAGGDYNTGGLREGQPKYKQSKLNYHSKCQLLIPHRVAIALVDSGWVLRNTIIWHKLNAMPESVTDRFSKKYEYIFMFAKQEKYYFDLDAIREKCPPLNRWGGNKLIAKGQSEWDKGTGQITYRDRDMQPNDGMKNPGDVWKYKEERTTEDNFFDMLGYFIDETGRKPTEKDILWIANCTGYKIPLTDDSDFWQIPTQPSSEKHYAMWPERLVERMVKCSTKAGDIVLDPFCGSGSTLKVAEQLNRKGIGIDLGYHEMSKRRISQIQKEMFV